VTVLIDDQLLAAHLRGRWSPDDPDTYTTGYWYVRLCTAVALARGGSLAGPFEALPPHRRAAARRAVLSLPDHVRLLSLRELAPLMGSLATRTGAWPTPSVRRADRRKSSPLRDPRRYHRCINPAAPRRTFHHEG